MPVVCLPQHPALRRSAVEQIGLKAHLYEHVGLSADLLNSVSIAALLSGITKGSQKIPLGPAETPVPLPLRQEIQFPDMLTARLGLGMPRQELLSAGQHVHQLPMADNALIIFKLHLNIVVARWLRGGEKPAHGEFDFRYAVLIGNLIGGSRNLAVLLLQVLVQCHNGLVVLALTADPVCPLAKMYTLGSGFIPSANHAGGLRYHGMSSIVSELYDQGLIEARSVEQTEVFKAAQTFARVEGILPAPESSHAIKVAIDEAMKCKETGEEKNIIFGLTGTGYFDMVAYQKYNDGEMTDYIPTDDDLAKSIAQLPKVEG